MVLSTHLDLLRHHAAVLICMLHIVTTIRASNNGTHNKRCQAWTYEHISAAQPTSDTDEPHTHFAANRPHQR
jgi:hypothetical protein